MATITIPVERIVTAEMRQAAAQAAMKAAFQQAIETHVDNVARGRSFRNADSARGHTASTVPEWKADADAFVAWADAVWVYAFQELVKVETGQREVPSIEDFLAELPVMVWPD